MHPGRVKPQKKGMKLRIINSKSPEPFAIRVVERSAKRAVWTAPTINVLVHKVAEAAERVKRFDAQVDIELAGKGADEIKDPDGKVIDYKNVKIKGYLSTFERVTESDRQGDTVMPGAFRDTIPKFMLNPVLLMDHRNSVTNIAGKFTKMTEDKNGLAFEAQISNAPGLADLRFKVQEGMLVTTSMGGLFHFAEGGRKIFRVDLWEGSLVAIPANPDARFSVRSLSDEDRKYAESGGKFASYHDFLKSLSEAENLSE